VGLKVEKRLIEVARDDYRQLVVIDGVDVDPQEALGILGSVGRTPERFAADCDVLRRRLDCSRWMGPTAWREPTLTDRQAIVRAYAESVGEPCVGMLTDPKAIAALYRRY
jgi:hypothetical protein